MSNMSFALETEIKYSSSNRETVTLLEKFRFSLAFHNAFAKLSNLNFLLTLTCSSFLPIIMLLRTSIGSNHFTVLFNPRTGNVGYKGGLGLNSLIEEILSESFEMHQIQHVDSL